MEYFTSRVSNTFKPEFYRGKEPPNFYSKPHYDFFSYNGRRMGAHSGSSSDDLIFKLGVETEKIISFLSFNFERHGLKQMDFPELKKELTFNIDYKVSTKQKIFMVFESERINNFGYLEKNISSSNYVWVGIIQPKVENCVKKPSHLFCLFNYSSIYK